MESKSGRYGFEDSFARFWLHRGYWKTQIGLILATAHSGEPRTPDEALLVDIDLSILGVDEAVFDEYDRSIRAEYDWVPEESFRPARAKVLESFANRERLYRTSIYRKLYEVSACRNIQRALARLRSRVS